MLLIWLCDMEDEIYDNAAHPNITKTLRAATVIICQLKSQLVHIGLQPSEYGSCDQSKFAIIAAFCHKDATNNATLV